MKINFTVCALITCLLGAATIGKGQTISTVTPTLAGAQAEITSTYVFGDLKSINAALQQLIVHTKRNEVVVNINNQTKYLRVPPGETTLDKGEPITLAEVSVGDLIMARGRVATDQKSVPARQIIVMSKASVLLKQERDRAEWSTRGIIGHITALKAEGQEITLLARSSGGEKSLTIAAPEKAIFRRYAPGSVKFSDALPSSFTELKVGDQLRALGEKSADGARFTAEEIVTGSFRIVTGKIAAINVAANEITVSFLPTVPAVVPTAPSVVVVVTKDSMLRRLSPELIALIAKMSKPTAAANPAPPANAQPAGSAVDVQALIERLPPLTIADLKVGDMVRVSSTTGTTPTRVAAIALLTNIETLVNRPQAGAARGSASASLGLSSGALDGIGLP